MAGKPKHDTRDPEATRNRLQTPEASTLSTAEVEHFGDGGAAGYLERLRNCTFFPDEQQELLQAFYFKITKDAFSDEWAQLWKEPEFADDDSDNLNPKWVTAFRERRWLNRALAQIFPLAKKHGQDIRPLLWFGRYIADGEALSASDKRDILDLKSDLMEPSGDEAKSADKVSEQPSYLVAELVKELGVSSATLNKYATAAGVPTPGRGKRNHRYSLKDRAAILKHIAGHGTDAYIANLCQNIMHSEIETKLKNRN